MLPGWSFPAAVGLIAVLASVLVLRRRTRTAAKLHAAQEVIDGPTLARPVASIPRDRPVRVWPSPLPLAQILLWPGGAAFLLIHASLQPDAAPVGRDWSLAYHTAAALLIAAGIVLVLLWLRATPFMAADPSGIWVRTARSYPGLVFSRTAIWVSWDGIEFLILTTPSGGAKKKNRLILGIGLSDQARVDLDRGRQERHVRSPRPMRVEDRSVIGHLEHVVAALHAQDPRRNPGRTHGEP